VKTHRFYAPEAAPGARLTVSTDAAHKARDVLRLGPGSEVRVFDGRGSEYDARVLSATRRDLKLELGTATQPRPESPLRIVLAVSPLKGDKMTFIVQKACELGVETVIPVVSKRTDAAARPALQGTRQRRWTAVACEAAAQCGRAVVPRIAETVTLDRFLETAPCETRVVLTTESAEGPLASIPMPGDVLLLVGPPGGFTADELDEARTAGFRLASLGPRVLRSETAAVAAITTAQVLAGDFGASGPTTNGVE
jgi:16S rRNA (uracil1498-N3)-methyltransferase